MNSEDDYEEVDLPEDTVLLLITVGEKGKGIKIVTATNVTTKSLEELAAAVVRSTMNAGGTLRGILEELKGSKVELTGKANEPIVIA